MGDVVGFSRIDGSESPPRVELPRAYNLAADLLQRHVIEGRGDRIAIIDDDGPHTYRELAERAARSAGALRDLGIEPEQRVALCMLDTADFVTAFLGAILLGAVPVPLNTLLTTEDYAYLIRDSRARAVIASDALVGKVVPALPPGIELAVAPTALGGYAGSRLPWRTLVDRRSRSRRRPRPRPTTSRSGCTRRARRASRRARCTCTAARSRPRRSTRGRSSGSRRTMSCSRRRSCSSRTASATR